jgi:hypothetical protein
MLSHEDALDITAGRAIARLFFNYLLPPAAATVRASAKGKKT